MNVNVIGSIVLRSDENRDHTGNEISRRDKRAMD